MTRTTKLASVGVAAVVAVGALLILLALRAPQSNAAAPASLAPRFQLLRSAVATPSAGLSAWLASISDRVKATTGTPLNPALWEARPQSSGQSLYVAANDETICVMAWAPARYFSCTAARGVANGATPLVSSSSSGTNGGGVRALFPDGTSQVTLETADGTNTPLTMDNNLVSANVPGVPKTLRWSSTDGSRHSLRLGEPPDPEHQTSP